MNQHPSEAGNILIVDDEPANLDLLADILKNRGFRARRVLNGRAALVAATAEPPDLILLDINLPDFDGYTVCELLKALPAVTNTPVIFISALTETLDKVRAFRAGGVDYVTKPIQVEEIEARIGAQLHLRQLQKELAAKNESLAQSLASLRTMEELRDNLVHMVVHDIRSPLSGMLMSLGLILDQAEQLPESVTQMVRLTEKAAREVSDLAMSMLEVSRIEADRMPLNRQPHDFAQLAREAADSMAVMAQDKAVTIVVDAPPTPVEVDLEILRRVLVNVLNNALRFSPKGGTVKVHLAPTASDATLRITDQGPGIPAELHDSVFRKFGDARLRRAGLKQSVGLGLAFCRLAVEAHGGRIGVESTPGQGSTFWFTVPRPLPPTT